MTKCDGVSCSSGLDGHFGACIVDVRLTIIRLESIEKSCHLCTNKNGVKIGARIGAPIFKVPASIISLPKDLLFLRAFML